MGRGAPRDGAHRNHHDIRRKAVAGVDGDDKRRPALVGGLCRDPHPVEPTAPWKIGYDHVSDSAVRPNSAQTESSSRSRALIPA